MAEEKSGVEKLKNRLYAREGIEKIQKEDRTALTPSETDVPKSWGAPEPALEEAPAVPPPSVTTAPTVTSPEPIRSRAHMSFAFKFLGFSIAFFTVAAVFAGFVFFGGVNTTSPRNIDIELIVPSLVDGGAEMQLEIIVRNRNTTPLLLSDLVIDYPEGARNPNNPEADLSHDRLSIGTIESGEELKRTANVLLFGEEGQAQTIRVALEYSVEGSNSVFVREEEVTVTIGSSPVSLSIDGPREITAGQPFTFELTVRSNATTPLADLVVKGEYPFGFSLTSTQPQADSSRMWRLGTLDPGESKTIRVTGTIEGEDGDERIFRFIAGSNDDPTDPVVKFPYITIPQTLTINRPFIAGDIMIEGKSGTNIPVAAGSRIDGTVSWQNNLSDSVSDVEITLSFDGPALDESSIEGNDAFFQSTNNSLIWSKDENSELESVAPGAHGTFSFSFMTKSPGEGGVLITNPTINLNLTVRAVREEGAPETILSAASTKVTVASALALETEVLHFSGPFTNSGPMPPRAEDETTYTVRWTVTNSANAVGNGQVIATLPTYVRFIAAEAGSGISFNEGSRTVTWALGEIKAGAGYTGAARTGAFQVEILPSESQVGSSPALTSVPELTGQDRFANVNVSAAGEAATTKLVGDSHSGMDTVVSSQ
jgi:hypothetical protein